ncbi:hypothetical protein ABIF97_007683 [Bradyrhizobium japonicum]
MAIQPSDPPAAAVVAVKRAVATRVGNPKFPRSRLSTANRDAVFISLPHRIAYLAFGKIRRADDLRAAAAIGNWRFLVIEAKRRTAADDSGGEEQEPIAAATIVKSAATTYEATYELGDLNEGPFVAATSEAVRRAEKLPEVRNGAFEAFLLTVPAVHVTALWLQDRHGYADLLLTMPPSDLALEPYRPMASAAFLDVVQDLARKVTSESATRG